MIEQTNHDLWAEQAHEDFSQAAGALVNLAQDLDTGICSWDGITPADACCKLAQIEAAVAFARGALGAQDNR